MKRIAILLGIIASMMLTSCTKVIREEYYIDPDIANVLINVSEGDWAYVDAGNNSYFCARVRVSEITRSVMSESLVKMYRIKDKNVQEELPISFPIEYLADDGNWYFYTEHIDYDFEPGYITIYYRQSDFEYELDPLIIPNAMQFRCVIMY